MSLLTALDMDNVIQVKSLAQEFSYCSNEQLSTNKRTHGKIALHGAAVIGARSVAGQYAVS